MIKTIIIDDDKGCIEALSGLCEKHLPQVQVAGTAGTIDEGLKLIGEVGPELVFLDVELNGEFGFDLFKKLPQPRFRVIFTTAHEKYALKAIKASCLEFLLKPVDDRELRAAVEKFEQQQLSELTGKKLGVLLGNLSQPHSSRIVIPGHDSHTFLSMAEIICCEADMNYTNVFTDKGEKIVSSKNLKEFEGTLDPAVFFRCHKSWLININYIKKFMKGESRVLMTNNKLIDVSIRKKEEFMSLFKKF
jgi:two-component system, LytTR family, response regulator